jgi:hypothetical protein
LSAFANQWWPVILILAGIGLLILALLTRRPAGVLPAAPVQEPLPAAPVVEPAASISQAPAPSSPAPQEPVAPAGDQPAGIYDILAQQPPAPATDDEGWG